MSKKPEALAKLRLQAPTRLTEVYYECSPTVISAFQTATGLAQGNADLYTKVMWFFALNIIILFIVYYDKKEVLSPVQMTERKEELICSLQHDMKILANNNKFLAECLLMQTSMNSAGAEKLRDMIASFDSIALNREGSQLTTNRVLSSHPHHLNFSSSVAPEPEQDTHTAIKVGSHHINFFSVAPEPDQVSHVQNFLGGEGE